jgi:hypothetical protein
VRRSPAPRSWPTAVRGKRPAFPPRGRRHDLNSHPGFVTLTRPPALTSTARRRHSGGHAGRPLPPPEIPPRRGSPPESLHSRGRHREDLQTNSPPASLGAHARKPRPSWRQTVGFSLAATPPIVSTRPRRGPAAGPPHRAGSLPPSGPSRRRTHGRGECPRWLFPADMASHLRDSSAPRSRLSPPFSSRCSPEAP